MSQCDSVKTMAWLYIYENCQNCVSANRYLFQIQATAPKSKATTDGKGEVGFGLVWIVSSRDFCCLFTTKKQTNKK